VPLRNYSLTYLTKTFTDTNIGRQVHLIFLQKLGNNDRTMLSSTLSAHGPLQQQVDNSLINYCVLLQKPATTKTNNLNALSYEICNTSTSPCVSTIISVHVSRIQNQFMPPSLSPTFSPHCPLNFHPLGPT